MKQKHEIFIFGLQIDFKELSSPFPQFKDSLGAKFNANVFHSSTLDLYWKVLALYHLNSSS
jgi:hypothetical protein